MTVFQSVQNRGCDTQRINCAKGGGSVVRERDEEDGGANNKEVLSLSPPFLGILYCYSFENESFY